MLWPLTIACIDESGNRLPGAAIEVRETLNPSVSIDAYDIDGQLVASPVAGPTGMAKVFLRNGYIDYRYVLDPYESEWITDLAIAPFGRAGRWTEAGGTIAAGATTDFPLVVPNLGIEKVPRFVVLTFDFDHPSVEDLVVSLLHPVNPNVGRVFGDAGAGEPANPSGAFSGAVTVDDLSPDAAFNDPMVLTDGATISSVGGFGQGPARFGDIQDTTLLYAEGTWNLRFVDSGTAGGTLNSWTLFFRPNLGFA
jgi:hypothetical protein